MAGRTPDTANLTLEVLREIRREAKRTNDHLGSVEQRLESMDERLESMDERLESMDGRLESMDGRLESMDGRLGTVEVRLESLENTTMTGFRIVKENLDAIRVVAIERHLDLDGRVRVLEKRVLGSDQT